MWFINIVHCASNVRSPSRRTSSFEDLWARTYPQTEIISIGDRKYSIGTSSKGFIQPQGYIDSTPPLDAIWIRQIYDQPNASTRTTLSLDRVI